MAISADQKGTRLYGFGPFRVDPEKELLLRYDEAVPLAPKAFQVLLVLMRHSREVVTKDDLLKAVWPDTFVEEANLSRNIFLLRKALGESPHDHQYIVTIPGRGYRFAEEVTLLTDEDLQAISAEHPKLAAEESKPWKWLGAAGGVVVLLATGALGLHYLHHRPVLTDRDTVVLGDFDNQTGDPVFDGTLRQGLAVELEQSPFLSLISDQRIQQTLQQMDQPPDTRMTAHIAQDVCLRTESAAYLTGSVARLGNQYVLGMKAVSCSTGDTLAEEQETAEHKEAVVAALDRAAGKLRGKLGESLKTVQKFDTPLEQATTPSLEALQAFTLGRKTQVGKDEFAASIPFFQRSIQIDPRFAMAYSALSSAYRGIGESLQGEQNATKAYELRGQISEPERFYVESTYYHYATGDLDKARQVYEQSAQTYPRYSGTPLRLWQLYFEEGQFAAALPQIHKAIQLDPSRAINYTNLVANLISLDRLQEANVTAQQTMTNGFGSSDLRRSLYVLAFLSNDAAKMNEQANVVIGKGGPEAQVLELQADSAAYFGRLKASRALSQQAAASAARLHENETAAGVQVNAYLIEVLFGNGSALRLPREWMGRRAHYAAALTFALAGNSAVAQSMADELAKRYPEDTLVRFNFLPAIRAQLALNRNEPARAIDLLQPSSPYELSDSWWGFLGPVYVRGEAYLMARKGKEAAIEFQKILDHRGIVANSPSGALAHLQLARAYALSGDIEKAKDSYQDFLTLWKDADADIPVLRQAKAEYAKLK